MPGPVSDSNPGPPSGTKQNVVTCVFCGHAYPTGTPRAQHDALYEHVGICEKHPASIYRKKLEAIREVCDFLDAEKDAQHIERYGEQGAANLKGMDRPSLSVVQIRRLLDGLSATEYKQFHTEGRARVKAMVDQAFEKRGKR